MKKRIILFRKAITQEGGAERLMLEVSDKFRKEGHEVLVSAIFKKDPQVFFDGKYKDIKIVSLSEGSYPSGIIKKIYFSIISIFWFRKIAREFAPDIILGQSPADAELIRFSTAGMGIDYSIFIHGSLYCFPDETLKYSYPFRKAFKKIRSSLPGHIQFIPEKINSTNPLFLLMNGIRAAINYISVREAKNVFCLSERMCGEVKELYGRDAISVKCGVNPELFGYEPRQNIRALHGVGDECLFVDVSRLVSGKRIDLSIRAFSLFSKSDKKAKFIVCGRGPEMDNLKKLVLDLNLEGKVILVGYVDEGAIADYYACADIVLHPAWIDFDITVMEGLSLNKKIVVSSEYDISGNLTVFKEKMIFSGYPDAENISAAMQRAATAISLDSIEMNRVLLEYTWEGYSRKILDILIGSEK